MESGGLGRRVGSPHRCGIANAGRSSIRLLRAQRTRLRAAHDAVDSCAELWIHRAAVHEGEAAYWLKEPSGGHGVHQAEHDLRMAERDLSRAAEIYDLGNARVDGEIKAAGRAATHAREELEHASRHRCESARRR
jgi:hypothetical protein